MANATNYKKMVHVWRGNSGGIYLSPYNERGQVIYDSIFTRKLPEYYSKSNQEKILNFITSDGILYKELTFVFDIKPMTKND